MLVGFQVALAAEALAAGRAGVSAFRVDSGHVGFQLLWPCKALLALPAWMRFLRDGFRGPTSSACYSCRRLLLWLCLRSLYRRLLLFFLLSLFNWCCFLLLLGRLLRFGRSASGSLGRRASVAVLAACMVLLVLQEFRLCVEPRVAFGTAVELGSVRWVCRVRAHGVSCQTVVSQQHRTAVRCPTVFALELPLWALLPPVTG